jgi:hypothetical protein
MEPFSFAHRLLSGGEIDNRQAAVGEPDSTGAVTGKGFEIPFAVGTPVSNRVRHAAERGAKIVAKISRQVAGNPAHAELYLGYERA